MWCMPEGGCLCAGNADARKNEERQGVNPAPADLQLLAGLRLDACDSSSLTVEQYKVCACVAGIPRNALCSPHVHRQLFAPLIKHLLG